MSGVQRSAVLTTLWEEVKIADGASLAVSDLLPAADSTGVAEPYVHHQRVSPRWQVHRREVFGAVLVDDRRERRDVPEPFKIVTGTKTTAQPYTGDCVNLNKTFNLPTAQRPSLPGHTYVVTFWTKAWRQNSQPMVLR